MIGKGKVERKKKNGKVTTRNGWAGNSDYEISHAAFELKINL